MQINEVEMHDALVNPFDQLTDKIKYLKLVDHHEEQVSYQVNDFQIFINFELDSLSKTTIRKRYSFWEALSDVGGFNDGLTILVSIIMSPLSRAYFIQDTLKK